MAESLEPIGDDLVEWELKLQPDIHFGNGDPLTGDAVKFGIERLAASSRAGAGLAQGFAEIEVVDPLTVHLTMRTPNGSVPYSLAAEPGMLINPKVVAERGDGFGLNPAGAGMGPYEFTRYAPGEELVLTAKDDSWGGPVCIETLRFVYVPGARATLDAFDAGELDVAFLSDQNVINDARDAGNEAYSRISGGNGALLLDNRAGRPTADQRVRQAIAAAVDPAVIDQRAFAGEGRPTSSLIHDEQRISPGVPGPTVDVARAKALVAEVKATGWDGRVNLVYGNDPSATEVSVAMQAMLGAVGMTVDRENLPTLERNARIITPPYDYDIGSAGFAIVDDGPVARMNQFLSDSVRNRPGYANADMDAAILALQAATDEAGIIEAVGEIQRVWNETVPSAVFAASEWYIAAKPEVHGLTFTRDVVVLYDQAWVEQ